MILHSFHVDIDDSDLEQLKKAVNCRSTSGGSEAVCEYEARLAQYFGARFALAFSSGTAALHASLAALDVGPGDNVIMSAAGTIEAVLAVLSQNAIPVFVDVQENSWNFDLADLQAKIGPRTKAVISVPMWGYTTNVDSVVRVCAAYGVPVVEDVALSVGASIGHRKIGTLGAIGCASTHERKLMCTGEGGFAVTNDEALADRMREVQRYGMVYRKDEEWNSILRRAGYLLGWNYKMNAFTAAVGISQVGKLEQKIAKRTANALTITGRLADCAVASAYTSDTGHRASYYALALRIDGRGGKSAREFALALKALGIISDTLEYDYRPLYDYPVLRDRAGYGDTDCPFSCTRFLQNYESTRCPNVEQWTRSVLTLPTHEALTAEQLNYICEAFHEVSCTFAESAVAVLAPAPWAEGGDDG